MQLSVIIPIYNVENTLDRCLKSVLNQSVVGMEVILVDDGSPDNCPVMCDKWARKDKRIRVIHKQNGGLSDARNAGIEIAKGEYITFVDSDDWVLPDTYKPLMAWLKEHADVDILEFPVEQETMTRQTLATGSGLFASAKEYWEYTMAWSHTYACNKIYRRRLFDDVRFPVGKVFEDIWTLPLLLAKNPKVATLSMGGYHYTWNENGISSKASAEVEGLHQHLDALVAAREVMHTTLLSRNGWNLYKAIMCRQIDLYRLTGEVKSCNPLVGLICRLHKIIKR